MYIYVYMYICIHTYIHTYMHTYIPMPQHGSTRILIYAKSCILAYTHILMFACMRAYWHIHTY